jgi:hypothetical protein
VGSVKIIYKSLGSIGDFDIGKGRRQTVPYLLKKSTKDLTGLVTVTLYATDVVMVFGGGL